MGRAEVGSLKHLSNKMKAKGLQRLRWYCQVCEKQCRDENGFKCHTQSESHLRQMMVVGENAKKHIADYSNQFKRDFLTLLRTAHGEKKVHANHFYQEYISDKDHIHMNATRWNSLSEFIKYLGREGVCRVEDGDKGLFISWIDNSPEALRRQEAIRRKERQDRGDEDREQAALEYAMKRARKDLEEQGKLDEIRKQEEQERVLRERAEGEKITIAFGPKPGSPETTTPSTEKQEGKKEDSAKDEKAPSPTEAASASTISTAPVSKPVSFSAPVKTKPKNVFAAANKKAKEAGVGKKTVEQPKKISEAEKIRLEEEERKRKRQESFGFSMNNPNKVPIKKQRVL